MNFWDRLKQGDREYAASVAANKRLKITKCVYDPSKNYGKKITQEEVAESYKQCQKVDKIISITKVSEHPPLMIAAVILTSFVFLLVIFVGLIIFGMILKGH
jgi:hypothetical protein